MIPFRTPFVLPFIYRSLLWRVPVEEKTLFLTFDDGPVPGPTEQVLDILARRGCKASFFCIGDNVRKHPNIFHKVEADQHLVGNHTFNHLNGWRTDADMYVQNVSDCAKIIAETNGHSHPLFNHFRPPYGRITFRQVRKLQQYRIVMWDVLTHDYNSRMSADYCLRQSISATRNGSIVVFHDSIKAERNMSFVLPRYIDHFASLGYQFKSLPS